MKQPKYHFYLESRKNQSGDQLIYFCLNYGFKEYNPSSKKYRYLTLKISTRWSILKVYWDGKPNYRANQTYVRKHGKDINSALNHVKDTSIDQLLLYRNEHKANPHPDVLKKRIFKELERIPKESNDVLITDYIDSTIQHRQSLPSSSKKYWGNNTIKQYKNLKAHIETHQGISNKILSFGTLDEAEYWKLFNVINDNYKEKEGVPIKHNTIAKICKHLRAILKDADNNDIDIAIKLERSEYKISEVKVDNNTSLDEEQLFKIFNADTSHSSEFNNARNYILFSSLTALRLGDMKELYNCKVETYTVNKVSFKGFKTKIRKTRGVTNELQIIIPLANPLLELIKENGGEFPKFPSNQAIGRQIKKFLKFMKFDQTLEFKEWYYGESEPRIEKHYQYEVFSPHSCRYTFITNMSKLRVPEQVVKNITHPTVKDRNILDGYNLSSLEDNAYSLLWHLNESDSEIFKFN